MTKKKKELDPEIIEPNYNKDNLNELKEIATNLNENIYDSSEEEEDTADSFFRNVINKLFNKENISSKTEYLDVSENFAGTKLTFLAEYGNMPYLTKFVEIFETKRISLQRKGRQEIIMALGERQKEVEQQQQNQLKNMLGMN